MYCIWRLILNEYQNDIHVWSVSELYLEEALDEYQNGIRICSISVLYLEAESE